MKPNHILVIEDEPVLQELLAYHLARQGYRVETASDGKTGLEKALRLPIDMVVLDLMLPVMDGFDVCRLLRQERTIPILILTARDEELDRVMGLEIGADDYITKPFSIRELLARVKAQLRRVQIDHDDQEAKGPSVGVQTLQTGNLELNLVRHEVRLDGQLLSLKPKEFALLTFLVQHRNQALTRESILEQVWGWDYVGSSRTVDVHMSWLRDKIEPNPEQPVRIVTIRGAGYRFEG